jgi:hypothetical protein
MRFGIRHIRFAKQWGRGPVVMEEFAWRCLRMEWHRYERETSWGGWVNRHDHALILWIMANKRGLCIKWLHQSPALSQEGGD